jgi:hypothetical protein
MSMPKNPLSKTNPYLRDAEERKALLFTAVSTSSAIEGVRVATAKYLQPKKQAQPTACHEAEESYGPRR